MTTSKYATRAAVGTEVDRLAEAYLSEHQGVSYKEALHGILAAHRELAQTYAQPSSRVTAMKPLGPRPAAPATAPVAQGNPASVEVDRRVQALIAEHPHLDYNEAMGAVLNQDPTLKARYAGVQR